LAAFAATGGALAAPVAAADLLPDMRAERPAEIHIVNVIGHRLLNFTAVMVNVGDGPMEVLGRRSSSIDPWTVTQVIRDDAGGSRRVDTEAYLVYAGDGHDHWHVRKMMAYHLFSTRATRGDSKVGFCFFDTTLRYPSLPGSPSVRYYREPWCGTRTATTSRTGISVGWGDRYSWRIASSGSTSPGCRAASTCCERWSIPTTGSSRRTTATTVRIGGSGSGRAGRQSA
jgi:hypothetical protein